MHATILGADSYADFLNWYYYLISLVDTNIGTVLLTVLGPAFSNTVFTNPSSNTAIVFISDHGDYGGSHGLHAKAGAAYDESLRVPLYVVTPGQSRAVALNQMCSMVDIFKLVVELALGTQYSGWETNPKYLDQYFNQNQSIFSFIQNQATVETRRFWDTSVTPNVWHPFILTTTDEFGANALPWTNSVKYNYNPALRSHLMCMRTKSDASEAGLINPYAGGKLVIYSKWVDVPQSYFAPTVDGTLASGGAIVQDYEYYDYQNYQNRTEVSYLLNGNQTGSDYPPALRGEDSHGIAGSGPGAQHLLSMMATNFGNMQIQNALGQITPASGFVNSILTRSLTGFSGSTSLKSYTQAGLFSYYQWLQAAVKAIS